jgi:menaquinone-specific isochorismate synthase
LVTIQDTELKEGIELAIARAKQLSKPVLVSEVQEIDHIEPLSFFSAGKEFYEGERFFWKDPAGQTVFAGVGICKQIQSDQTTDRFFHVEKEWQTFIHNRILIGNCEAPATGPIMFGGFSFDPLKEKTALWSKFSDALFHIPLFLLSMNGMKTYLTTNMVCTQDDHVADFEQVIQERQKLLTSKRNAFNQDSFQIMNEMENDPEKWKNTVRNLVEELKEGDLKKTVLAREMRVLFDKKVAVDSILNRLLEEQPDSFTFAFESKGDCFLGASPERLVKKQGKNLFSTCLAGSIKRGKTAEEDESLGEILLTDEKNIIEHQYVVEMIKNAMEQVCSNMEIPDQPVLMKMRDIQHLYTPVLGIAATGSSLLQLVELLHPTPALGGLPKKEAVEKIREIEELDRGMYASPIGWMDHKGNGEFAVGIRSALIQGNEATLFAGCGIVKDSDAESEYLETGIKFRPMLSALGGMK